MPITHIYDPAGQCHSKRTYPNSREAKQAARWTMATQGGSKMIAYRCPHCKKWHAGHKVGSAR